MIALYLLGPLSWAGPSLDEIADAARLLVDEAKLEGVDQVKLRARLVDGLPWIQVHNTGSSALSIVWEQSTITPPNASPVPLFPMVRAQHDPVGLVESPVPAVLDAGQIRSWAVFPMPWINDTINNEEQIASWSSTSFSGLHLALLRGEQNGSYDALWRTEIDQTALVDEGASTDLPLAIPVESRVPMPMAEVDLDARRRWDLAYRTYRKQAQSARSVWITSAVVGGLCALGTASSVKGMLDAPVEGPDDADITRAEYRDSALLYGGLTAGSIGLTVPMIFWERSSERKLAEMGRRP